MLNYFGVRHLSPAGAWHLIQFLEIKKPKLVLIEGPSDLSEIMEDICKKEVRPPIAIMAYSKTIPIRSIIYPFSEYSPEYQAMLWAKGNKISCRFIDLPSQVFISFSKYKEEKRIKELENENSEDKKEKLSRIDIYNGIAEIAGEECQEDYWERNFEHIIHTENYHEGAIEYGKQLRQVTDDTDDEMAENIIREAYMKRKIMEALEEGFAEEDIVVITGAYHVQGLKECEPLTDGEIKKLPKIETLSTLMPYSNYRLSSMSGYGAGNNAPAYYELLWEAFKKGDTKLSAYKYLSGVAASIRKSGGICSSAEVIEAVRLAFNLAYLKNSPYPILKDLRDAAMTCMGHGSMAEIAIALADNEVGTKIGHLPEGVSRTSVQEDFYRELEDLRLEKYKSVVAENLALDLRENTRVKSEKSAFLDLRRSFFLHRLQTLGIHFAQKEIYSQDNATWAERWILAWTPEAEIEIVEAALKGDTVEQAVAFTFKESLDNAVSITETAEILENACMCGMPEIIRYATSVLQSIAVDASSFGELAQTSFRISNMLKYGDIRKLELSPLKPILSQLFLRAVLILTSSCLCNNNAVAEVIEAIKMLNEVSLSHDFLDEEKWIKELKELSNRDDLNTKASGFATAILLERGKIDNELLKKEVSRRLSKGIPADLGAGWFEGLALKNRYALIARLSLWEELSNYIDTLDDEEFKRALVFLRRAFTDFSPNEKREIAENLGEVWGYVPEQVEEALSAEMTEKELEQLDELSDFDFDDL